MTDLAGALADNSHLTPYRGRQVLKVAVALRNAGDGLSEAQSIDPRELEQGDEVYVLYRTIVGPHKMGVCKGFEADEKDAPLTLTIDLLAREATFVERDFAADRIRQQTLAIQKAKDAAEGIGRLDAQPGAEGWDGEHDEDDARAEGNGTVHQFPSNGVAGGEPGEDEDGYYDPAADTEASTEGDDDNAPIG